MREENVREKKGHGEFRLKMGKFWALLLTIVLSLGLVSGCAQTGGQASSPSAQPSAQTAETPSGAASDDNGVAAYKIGVVTPTFSASEDEYRGGEKAAQLYPNIVKHITLPENFEDEQETAISQIVSLASDPEMKGIVICAGYSGFLPAIQQVKEQRPDITVITAPIWDDPYAMSEYVDLCLDTDWEGRGVTIVEKAYDMGARTFIHYSFPTHMSKEQIVNRHDNMKATCDRLGMTFVDVSTPDPQAGTPYSEVLQFLQEDIPQQIEKYGKDTCIFGTNCGMQDVIIKLALEYGYIMAEQCCPTPTQGFPAAMGLTLSEEESGDFDKINQMITEKAAEAGATGRLSTWPIAVGVFFPEFSVELIRGVVEDGLDLSDMDAVSAIAQDVAGVEVQFNPMAEDIDNYYLILMDSIIY